MEKIRGNGTSELSYDCKTESFKKIIFPAVCLRSPPLSDYSTQLEPIVSYEYYDISFNPKHVNFIFILLKL